MEASMKYKSFIIVTIIFSFLSCNQTIRINRFSTSFTFPPTNPDRVNLLRKEPSRSYIELGEISITPTRSMRKIEVNRILKVESAKMGAQAVIIQVDTFFRTKIIRRRFYRGRTIKKRRLHREKIIIGTAIRYRN
jgi:hypothetical protein